MQKLEEPQIEEKLKALPQWSELNGAIQRTFQFKDFVASMSFVERVAAEAERVQHHPDILIRYNKVTLTLSTHDAGGITDNDFEFASFSDSTSSA